MAAQGLILACSSTPQEVAGAFTGPTTTHGYIRISLKNLGTGTAYLGSSSVTTGGYPLSSGDAALTQIVAQGETLWVASSSGATPSLAILRLGDTT